MKKETPKEIIERLGEKTYLMDALFALLKKGQEVAPNSFTQEDLIILDIKQKQNNEMKKILKVVGIDTKKEAEEFSWDIEGEEL